MGHCDKVLGWVCLFSFGCTAKFWVKGPNMPTRKVIDFESGDVLLFNGGTEYNIQHGINTIVEGTCPAFIPAKYQDKRISLQFRQTLRNDNVGTGGLGAGRGAGRGVGRGAGRGNGANW